MGGLFITFEGGEGAGKTTQIRKLAEKLEEAGHAVIVTREPGGTKRAEMLREYILQGAAEALGNEFEAVLFTAARLDHVENLILPALEKGLMVLCDRFADSTRVYQGGAGGVSSEVIDALEDIVRDLAWPNLTIILDIDPEIGLQRAAERRQVGEAVDRFEKEGDAIHYARRLAFLQIASDNEDRCMVFDGSAPAKKVHKQIWNAVKPLVTAAERMENG